ncbi:uncharacterized protein LOC113351962 [Papaver somniferum]|uniref:uncharacterized protein LOC113351962 n=1 Tax=Papaver somniferum TaxID=3469 RepID=UPI000E6F68EA|nr:uncharacterized protein LOC113351962 [Papaver somniferum]
MSALNDDDIRRTFGMVSRVCDAPILDDPSLHGDSSAVKPSFQYAIGSLVSRLSYAVSSDYQRKLLNLGKENTKPKAENSTNVELLRKARERNDEIIDIYNLSDEASNFSDEETVLEHLNSSLNNYPTKGFENLSLEELRLKYTALRMDHRPLLTTLNNFKRRFHENKETIQLLEEKKNTLITEKDEVALKGAKALEKFQETILKVQNECDLALSENLALIEERNLIRSRVLIESETEFSWAARVLNDARENLVVNVSLQSEHSALVKDIISNHEDKEKNYLEKIEELKTQLAAREKTRLEETEKLSVIRSQLQDVIRARDAAVKKVCVDNGIPLSKYKFADVPPNDVVPDIIDSEEEYEEYEEYEEEGNNSEDERNDEDN